jgi:hypothetical protein
MSGHMGHRHRLWAAGIRSSALHICRLMDLHDPKLEGSGSFLCQAELSEQQSDVGELGISMRWPCLACWIGSRNVAEGCWSS